MQINENGVVTSGYLEWHEVLTKKKEEFTIKIVQHEGKRYGTASCQGPERGQTSPLTLTDPQDDPVIQIKNQLRGVWNSFKNNAAPAKIIDKIIKAGQTITLETMKERFKLVEQELEQHFDMKAKVGTPPEVRPVVKIEDQEHLPPIAQAPIEVTCINTGMMSQLTLNKTYRCIESKIVKLGKKEYKRYSIELSNNNRMRFDADLFTQS